MRSRTGLVAFLAFTLGGHITSHAQGNDEVIYHVVQRSFYDSNGDGEGDLKGLRSKLGYLQDLGVTAILMLPLYNSVYYHNYFASDFETIDPEFGDIDDCLALIRDVHLKGMKVYLDMETQYVTEDHLWYKDSYQKPESVYSNYLVYNGPGNTDPESIIFGLTSLEGYDGTTRKVTTVNLLNPDVLKYNITLFSKWVDPNGDGSFGDGVDGFRLDHMMDDLDWKGKFTGLFEKFWTPLIDSLKSINPNLVFIAEQAEWGSWGEEYLEHGNVDRVFGFNLASAIESMDKHRIARVADSTFAVADDIRDVVVFIENHDTDRFASRIQQDTGKMKVAAALNLLVGGTPSIYYGQELGMTGAGGFGKFGNSDGNDIPRREAFEWYETDDVEGMALWYKNSGPWWDQRYAKDNDGISLEEEMADAKSLWHTYRRLLKLRKWYPALEDGVYTTLDNANDNVFSFMREGEKQRLLIAVNLSTDEQTITVNPGGIRAQNVIGRYGIGSFVVEHSLLNITLPPYGVTVIEIVP